MAQAKKGDTVKVNYTGKLDSGEIFDSSESCECGCESGPLQFTIGEGQVIPGFEDAVVGMAPGDSKTVKIPMDQAYGPRVEEMVAEVERAHLPEGADPVLGQQYEVAQDDGSEFQVIVTAMTDTTVTLDANHPLAGQDLTFDITLMEIC